MLAGADTFLFFSTTPRVQNEPLKPQHKTPKPNPAHNLADAEKLGIMARRVMCSSLLPSLFKRQSGRRRDAVTFTARHAHQLASTGFEPDELHDEVRAAEKDAALRLAVTELAGEFGRESMLSLQRFFKSRHAPVVSTGSLKLDLALGIGGLPKGRMVEIYGQEASGKTTLALHVIKEAQKLGGCCAYLDVENALDSSLAASIGVNSEKLLICPPDSAENLLSMVDTLTKSGSIDVIVVDSVAALLPQTELDTIIGGTFEDAQSRIMTQALRKIHYSLSQSGTLIIFLNQVRSGKRSVKHFKRAEEVTCGGNSLKFYSAIRLRMIRKELCKTGEKVTGLRLIVEVVKNKLAPAKKKAELGIHFGKGLCRESEILELACENGIIIKEGSMYFIEGEVLGDKRAAEFYLAKNEKVVDKILTTLRGELFEWKV